ncbi:hypothetical protein ABC383_01290 [Noviherbaspirillum sp. 1P10PC]|uniref:hypothetical protein n=1 Tax=Noviherbaspirillum sp. 1P10PC TaxID=3132292 RepID=UPI0039A0D224
MTLHLTGKAGDASKESQPSPPTTSFQQAMIHAEASADDAISPAGESSRPERIDEYRIMFERSTHES